MREWKENESFKNILDRFATLNNMHGIEEDSQEGDFENTPVILVAEDNRVNQIVVGEILAQAGIRYEIVESGRLACEAIMKSKYDLVLMDCQMPEMDGFQATRLIREMEQEKKTPHIGRIPIIALTANATREDEEHCLSVGMDAYCSKPINAAQLVEIVQKWLPERPETTAFR